MLRDAVRFGGMICVALAGGCGDSTEMSEAGPQSTVAATQQTQPGPEVEPVAAPPASRSTRDGIYTVAQAERGGKVFTDACSACHSPDEWSQAAFLQRWSGQRVHSLYTWVHDEMPSDAPGSLSSQQYADVLAYIFSLNKLPTSGTELGTEDESLMDIQIDWEDGR